jgi:hypothetical protein
MPLILFNSIVIYQPFFQNNAVDCGIIYYPFIAKIENKTCIIIYSSVCVRNEFIKRLAASAKNKVGHAVR